MLIYKFKFKNYRLIQIGKRTVLSAFFYRKNRKTPTFLNFKNIISTLSVLLQKRFRWLCFCFKRRDVVNGHHGEGKKQPSKGCGTSLRRLKNCFYFHTVNEAKDGFQRQTQEECCLGFFFFILWCGSAGKFNDASVSSHPVVKSEPN